LTIWPIEKVRATFACRPLPLFSLDVIPPGGCAPRVGPKGSGRRSLAATTTHAGNERTREPSAFGLARRLNIPRKEAADTIEAYFTEFPTIKQYLDESINRARQQYYVETILDHRRYLRDVNSRTRPNVLLPNATPSMPRSRERQRI
jgi:hypothetical protein